MGAVYKQEQVIVDNAIPSDVEFYCPTPFKIASSGDYTLKTWNGVAFVDCVGEVITVPKFVAAGGRYAISAVGAVTVAVSPLK